MGTPTDAPLSRAAASAGADPAGWRLLLGTLAASFPVDSLRRAVEVATAITEACGADADEHLRLDVRADRVEATLETRSLLQVTARDVELARAVTTALGRLGVAPAAPAGRPRPVQSIEIAIDALDIPAVRPFWQAVLGYADEPVFGDEAPEALIDPAWQGPTIWFQQMDEPRPQRNRIHFDVTVAPDEAPGRIAAALAAGGVLVDDSEARAFWVLADVEGNEACICTWQDRDPIEPPADAPSADAPPAGQPAGG